jgi:hypothetical protein
VEAIEDMDDSKAFDKLVATYKTEDIDAIAKMITKMITVTLNTQTFYWTTQRNWITKMADFAKEIYILRRVPDMRGERRSQLITQSWITKWL